ncbi:hypothetical protein ES288_D13G114400v1 [Gossypium darwinii]|uniref:Uncharacterized protein n=1 Tax=Gossypium darwinii TaxID=34276 RepID=A0A5D1ZWX1_GOSDA|nr:hypothetical protein ES288_D13G114400v1 [Gossypium darwinii]
MGLDLQRIVNAKMRLKWALSSSETTTLKRRDFFVLLSFLKHPSFQNLLCQAKEENGFNHALGRRSIH